MQGWGTPPRTYTHRHEYIRLPDECACNLTFLFFSCILIVRSPSDSLYSYVHVSICMSLRLVTYGTGLSGLNQYLVRPSETPINTYKCIWGNLQVTCIHPTGVGYSQQNLSALFSSYKGEVPLLGRTHTVIDTYDRRTNAHTI